MINALLDESSADPRDVPIREQAQRTKQQAEQITALEAVVADRLRRYLTFAA